MLRIIDCESGGRADAINYYNADGLYDYGLFQSHNDPAALDPDVALAHAHEMWMTRGTQPWVSSRGCWGRA